MMPAHASDLDRFLAGMEYPATTDDLIREASRDGLSERDIAVLGTLPLDRFDSCFHVRRTLTMRRDLVAA